MEKYVIRRDPAIVSVIERCPLYSMSATDSYDCIRRFELETGFNRRVD